MNYEKAYDNIITKAQSENRKKISCVHANYIQYEDHHIIPRCVGGTDAMKNMVLLTLREHFVCHKLLTKIYPNHIGIICAYKYMSSFKFKYNVSSRDFERAKMLYSSIPRNKKLNKQN